MKKFEGADGKRHLIGVLRDQRLISGKKSLAKQFAEQATTCVYQKGDEIIKQDADDADVFLILSGVCSIVVNGHEVAKRGHGNSVGEMVAIEPAQRRAATVIADEEVIAAKISESDFNELASAHPEIYRQIARELAQRLRQRNKHVGKYRDKIKVFIISSVESLEVAREIQNQFEHDPFTVTVWTDGVFRATQYTLESIESAIDDSDFAVAIAHTDDVTESREEKWPVPRDNVIFELGMFMGRLGRDRAILMEPRDTDIKLPSDLTGVTTIPYKFNEAEVAASMAPACNKLRTHFKGLGPNNG